MIHGIELEWIRLIHEFRGPFLDLFFKSLNFFDRKEFFFLLIPIIWVCLGWKFSLRFFYILLFGTLFNSVLKAFFASPRPFLLDSALGLISVHGYGFPSGAAQTAILLSGILLSLWKTSLTWSIAIIYTLLISFSRIYLGVHFPTDILAGWFFGALFLMAVLKFAPKLSQLLEKTSPLKLLGINILLALFLMFLVSKKTITMYAANSIGLGLGLWISHFYRLLPSLPKNLKESVLKVLFSISGLFLVYWLTSKLPNAPSFKLLQAVSLGLWLSLGSQLLFEVLFPSKRPALR